MKKTILSLLVFAVVFVSCGPKKDARPDTASGLKPSNFVTTTIDGKKTDLYVLKNANGMEVTVLNIGARIVSVMVPDKNGTLQNVVLGYDTIAPYLQLNDYYGAVVGRYANRISNESFMLDRVNYTLRTNEGSTSLHGGPRGFSTQYFDITQISESEVMATYMSKAKEEGFPGALDVTVTYTVMPDNALSIKYEATTSQPTVVNLSNHAYFNLSGAKATNVNDQALFIDAAKYTPVDENLIPTGAIENVTPTLDFTTAKTPDNTFQYDHNYVLNTPGDMNVMAAKLLSNTTGIKMEVYTTEPGIQLYIDKAKPSFCLETQHFPDSPNRPEFPSTVLRPGEVFSSQTIYKFGTE